MKNKSVALQWNFINQSQIPMPRKFLAIWCQQIEAQLKKDPGFRKKLKSAEVTLVFMDTQAAKRLNAKYRNKNYATDVLSFASLEGGDLVICPQVVQRQCREHGLSFKLELGYLVLHGLLHLFDYEHENSPKEAKLMFALQDRSFARAAKVLGLDWD